MCIIAISIDRYLTEQEIRNCFSNNPDGAGFAYVADDKVHVEKGFMTVEALLEAYQGIPLPHVVHWRTATSGGILPEMTHPYKMTEDSELFTQGDLDVSVLFHNGIISDWQTSLLNLVTSGQIKRMPKGPMNDTRMAAIMASLPNIGDDILEILNGKFVKIQPDGEITRWGDFEQNNGVLFSNNAYRWYRSKINVPPMLPMRIHTFRGKKIQDLTDEEWESYYHEEFPDDCRCWDR